MEIIATAYLLQTSNMCTDHACGNINKWQKHSPDQVKDDPHKVECIYNTNLNIFIFSHFETVNKCNILACMHHCVYFFHHNPLLYVSVLIFIHFLKVNVCHPAEHVLAQAV